MSTYIALLRGINVTGHKMIKMDALRAMFESAGAQNVRTYIQSGNVVFDHPEKDAVKLRKHVEAHLEKALGYAVPTLLRSPQEIAAIVASNPYPTDLAEFGKRMYICFLEHAPSAAAAESIVPYTNAEEQLMVKGSEAYVYYSSGLGKAKLTNVIIERKLGLATMRNWNTVNTLLEMTTVK